MSTTYKEVPPPLVPVATEEIAEQILALLKEKYPRRNFYAFTRYEQSRQATREVGGDFPIGIYAVDGRPTGSEVRAYMRGIADTLHYQMDKEIER